MGISYRSLESRIHYFNAPMQPAAFVAAMTAEGKCSTLGCRASKGPPTSSIVHKGSPFADNWFSYGAEQFWVTDGKEANTQLRDLHTLYRSCSGPNPNLREYKRPCYELKGPTKHTQNSSALLLRTSEFKGGLQKTRIYPHALELRPFTCFPSI